MKLSMFLKTRKWEMVAPLNWNVGGRERVKIKAIIRGRETNGIILEDDTYISDPDTEIIETYNDMFKLRCCDITMCSDCPLNAARCGAEFNSERLLIDVEKEIYDRLTAAYGDEAVRNLHTALVKKIIEKETKLC